ncbi:MAG: Glycosyl transferase family 2 [Thermotogales bacterium 46_20]|nr:MAG: Glycosyl transferase family 2 [Thermotogales bacterium 46_20]
MNLILTVLGWLAGIVLFWRAKPLKPPNNDLTDLPSASIIIPARNEEKNIDKLLSTLKDQCGASDEIIVVDDDSSDGTSAVVFSYGLEPIKLSGAPPEGWMGKSWACWNGYCRSTGDILIFLDADVELSPCAIETVKHKFLECGGFFSVQPYHRMERIYEKLSLFFNMIVVGSIGSFSLWKTKAMGAFGPCMICKKSDYEAVGGHKTVGDHVLDDIELARLFMRKGFSVQNALGGSVLKFRMYPGGLRDVILGWGKNFVAGARKTNIHYLILNVLWIGGAFSAFMRFPLSSGPSVLHNSFIYIAYVFQIWFVSRKLGSFGILTALLYPVSLCFFFIVFAYSMVRTLLYKSVIWKGRKISV